MMTVAGIKWQQVLDSLNELLAREEEHINAWGETPKIISVSIPGKTGAQMVSLGLIEELEPVSKRWYFLTSKGRKVALQERDRDTEKSIH